jgi:FkbM family methyltransferase
MRYHPGLEYQDDMIFKEICIGDAYHCSLIGKVADDEVVVDVGAQIGSFSYMWHGRNPTARIYSIEACYDNIELLKENVGSFATVIHAACTYEKEPLAMLNAVLSRSCTGGSIVASLEQVRQTNNPSYRNDFRHIDRLTIHDLMTRCNLQQIDFLKLDCEGCEFSVLDNAPLDKIGFIFAESHGCERWRDLLQRKFRAWNVGHISAAGECEIWHLCNPDHELRKPRTP